MKKMKPELEDILFTNYKCKHELEDDNKVFGGKSSDIPDGVCPDIKVNQESLERLVKEELKDKYYPEFVKYFKSNSNECITKSLKNSQKSVEARIKGNALLAKKDHDVNIHKEIWKLYSESIAFAPVGSKELVLAYECRSNLLLHFKKYEDCIKDIDRALSLTKFDLLKVKLLCRKMTCFVATNKGIFEKEKLWETIKCHLEKINNVFKDEKFSKMVDQAKSGVSIRPDKNVKDEQKSFTTFTSLAEVTSMLDNQKRIIADRDYKTGEAIIVTKPTMASVNPDKFYAYCSHCLSFMWAGIPCDECSLCMYCSEKCKEEAWQKYHIMECKVHPHLNFYDSIYYDFIISIKIFLMGVREFGSVPQLMEKIREIEQTKDDVQPMKNDKLFSSEFLNFYTLPNMSSCDCCCLSKAVKNICFLMAYLTQILSDIFEKDVGSMKGKELAKDEDFVLSTVVLLKIFMLCGLYMQYPCMEVSLKCPKYEDKHQCVMNRCCPEGYIFFFFRGLIEKSCNPNVSVCRTRDGKIIYYCCQPIKKMEMLTVAQTLPFYICDRAERHFLRSSLQSAFEFCKCPACEKEWPPMIEQFDKYSTIISRRKLQVLTEASKIVNKYYYRIKQSGYDLHNYIQLDKYEELVKDTNTVVNICGQPSFMSTLMIFMLCVAFKRMYGDIPLQLRMPKDC